MTRRIGPAIAVFAALVASLVGSLAAVAGPARAAEAAPLPRAAQAPPLPKAYVLVDADTGAVLAQQDDRTPRPPASTIKLLTALIAVERLDPRAGIPISPLAESMPARKINVKAGQVWQLDHLLHSMMMVSANDAAVAVAEKIGGGSLDGFVRIAQQTADRLGLADNPILYDPSGLDDEFSNKGGDRISPRDLAIISRAVLARPELLGVINTRDYQFTGGDGLPHTLSNHDLFLDLYPGANGLKTGATELAGHTFVGSATRNGRTMLAVVFDAVDYYGSAAALLDQGFNTPVSAEAGLDHLPPVVPDAAKDRVPEPSPSPVSGVAAPAASVSSGRSLVDTPAFAVLVLLVGLVPLVALRRRVMRRGLALHRVPDEARASPRLEQQRGGLLLVDVADEPVVDAVADELA